MTGHSKTSTNPVRQGLPASAVGQAAKVARFLEPIGAALFPPRVVLFIAFFAWYLYAVVDLRLVFLSRDVLFLWNIRYFTDFLGQPGSLMEWTDNLLVQLCYWGWPGALALAAAAWLLLVSTIGLMNALGHARIGGTWLFPAIALVVLYGGYTFPMSAVVGLALAITTANLWRRIPVWRPWLRLLAFLAISTVLYYVVGPAYYCFAACCAIHEGLAEKRWLSGVLFVLAAVGVKFGLDAVLTQVDPASHNFHVLSFELDREQIAPWNWRTTVLRLYFPVCALFAVYRQAVFALIREPWQRVRPSNEKAHPRERGESGKESAEPPDRLRTQIQRDASRPRKKQTSPKSARGAIEGEVNKARRNENRDETSGPRRGVARTGITRCLRWSGGTAVVLSLAAAAGFHSVDREKKLLQEIDYCAEHRLWDDLLEKVKALPLKTYSKYVNHDINLALYHTGRLPYRMFSYPQLYSPLFNLSDVSDNTALLCKPFDLLLEMGRINEAEHIALEMLEMRPCGGTLKRMALVKLIKGQSAAASVFLNVLRDDLVWDRWAEKCLERLATDPDLAGDEEIQRIRKLMLAKNDLHLTSSLQPEGTRVDIEAMLLNLLKWNRTNRMAFEYLMAIRLRNRDVEGAVELFHFLDGLSYTKTPPFYEEAAMLYVGRRPEEGRIVGADVFFRGRQISKPTMAKFRRFQAIAARSGQRSEDLEAALARELGGTYFHYFYGTVRKPS